MKRTLIVALSIFMLFAFVACDNETKTPESKVVSAMAGETSLSPIAPDKTVADFQKSVVIAEDGAVTGTFMYGSASGWGVDDEDEGYYLCVEFDVEEGTFVKVNDKVVKDSQWMLFLGTEALKDNNKKEFKVSTSASEKGTYTDLITLKVDSSSVFEPKATDSGN